MINSAAALLLSAAGFAQVCPSRELSASFVVECDRDPLEYPYIRKARLNGVTLGRDFLRCGEITAGGRLELTMSAETALIALNPVEPFGVSTAVGIALAIASVLMPSTERE